MYSSPLLESVNLKINTVVSIVICVECGVGISRIGVSHHLRYVHRYRPSQFDSPVQAINGFMDTLPPPELTYDTPAPSPLPPIQGIKIQKGYSCPSCNYHTVRLLTMKRHWRTTHQPIPIPTTFPRAYIQTISNSKTSPSFPVSYTPGPTFVSLTDREIYRFLHRYQTPQDPGHVPRVSDDEVEESYKYHIAEY